MTSKLSLGTLLLGIVLLVGSALWGVLFPASNSWTEEKALRMRELSGKAHLLSFKAAAAKANPSMHSGPGADAVVEYRAAQQELAGLRNEFENRRDAPTTASSFLRWSGIALVLLGGLAVMATRG